MEILWYNSGKSRFGSTSGRCSSSYSIHWSSRLCAVLLITGVPAFMLLMTSLWHVTVFRYVSRYVLYRNLCIEIRILSWGTRIVTPLLTIRDTRVFYVVDVCVLNRGRGNGRPIVRNAILGLSDKWLSLVTRPMDKQIIIAQMSFIHLGQVDIWFWTSVDTILLVRRTSASQISCQPLLKEYSVSPIYRGRVYRGIGYIAVTCWTPFFAHRFREFCRRGAQERHIFREITVNPCIQFTGDNFSRNLLTAIAFVPGRWRQLFCEINSSLPVNAGWNTCSAMGSHARRSIDTSIMSQSRVQLIQCQCKSRLQTANLGINNTFNQIVAVWPRCLHPASCPSLRQFCSKSSVRDW